MKKIFVWIITIILILLVGALVSQNKKEDNTQNQKVTVAEVTHSIFYAPQYVALALGYFEEEGLDVELTLAQGADAVMAAVLSEDVDIGFCGTEATIYLAA